MARSVSWVMGYHRRPQGEPDRIGGLPAHLPHVWPRCQICQDRMEFVGQLYSSERFPLGGPLGLQFFVCDGCRETYNGQANDRLPITTPALLTVLERVSGWRVSYVPAPFVKPERKNKNSS